MALRYPGPRSFEDSPLDHQLFCGRTAEKQQLLDLVLASHLVVLYARSGTGKTSLINAGLLQPLRSAHGSGYYFPLVARVNDLKRGPVGSVCDALPLAAQRARLEHVVPAGADATLRGFFHGLELWSGDQLLVPVLILDQFEELFTLYEAGPRRDFVAQFGELVRELSRHTGPPLLKVVISMREDFLGHLEELAQELPRIFATRFRLGPLRIDHAREAIVHPASLDVEGLATRPFTFEPAAVDGILAFLCQRRRGGVETTGDAEPFQLQLICQRAEEIVARRQREGGPERAVSLADLGGAAGLVEILSGYYDSVVRQQAEAEAIYRLCEKGLVSVRGRRLSLEEGEIVDQYQVPVDTLRTLVDRRLLRADPRLDSVCYELSHDTLIAAVRKSRRQRMTATWRRRLAVGSTALALLVVGTFFAMRTPWYHAQRAQAEGERILAAAARGSDADLLKALWSRVLACSGYAPDAVALVEQIQDDEAQAEALVRLAEMRDQGLEKDLAEKPRQAVMKLKDEDRRFELALRMGAWDEALSVAGGARDVETHARLVTKLIEAVRAREASGKTILTPLCQSLHPRTLPVALDIAAACARSGHADEARGIWMRALEQAPGQTDPEAAVAALARLGADMGSAGLVPEANRALAEGERRLAGLRDEALRVRLLAQLGDAALRAGLADTGGRLWTRAVADAGRLDPKDGLAANIHRYRAFRELVKLGLERKAGETQIQALTKRMLDEARLDSSADIRLEILYDAASMLGDGGQAVAAAGVLQEAVPLIVSHEYPSPFARFEALAQASDRTSAADPQGSDELWREAMKAMEALPPDERAQAESQVLSRLIRRDQIAEARALYGRVGADARVAASAEWANALVRRAERSSEAALLDEAEDAARAINEPEPQCAALAGVASGFARAGLYGRARGLVGSCAEDHRLHVQAEVLLAKSMQDWPDRAPIIRAVRQQDWTGGGGF